MDLAQMWRARQWRKLLNVIDRLPRNSALSEAMAEDEELAEQLLQRPPEAPAPTRRMSEYSPEVEMLSSLLDRVGEVIQLMVALKTGKKRSFKAAPRPVTAMERLRRHRRAEKHRSVVSRVLPHKADPRPDTPVEGAPDGVRGWYRVAADPAVVPGRRKGDGGLHQGSGPKG